MADVVKYGIQIPNRIFVGGIAFDTKEEELKEFFKQHGTVRDCKIVADKDGFSRGFGFVTFESKQEAIQTQKLGTVFFNQKKLNLGPAIRQKGVVFNGAQETANEPVTSAGVYIHPSGYWYTVAPNGVWYFHSDGSCTDDPPSTSQSPSTSTPMVNTTSVSLPKPQVTHVSQSLPAQPSAAPVTIIPTENMPQTYPIQGHYIIPQNVSIINANAAETRRNHFIPESNCVPYYISQPQQPMQQMNGFPVASPPPPQIHHMAAPVHMIGTAYTTPPIPVAAQQEMYHVMTSPYDPSIIEHGPFINTNRIQTQNRIQPAFTRPPGPIKRMNAEFPPAVYQVRRSYDALSHYNGGNMVAVRDPSNGSTPSSFSSSTETDPDSRDVSK